MIREVAGRQNHSVKLARKLQRKNHRRERGLLVGEGMDLLRAAVDAGASVCEILVRQGLVAELPSSLLEAASAPGSGTCHEAASVDIGVCDEETLGYASSLGGSADVIFTCREPAWSLADLVLGERVTFYLDRVGDPGNVGTLIRSGAAFALGGLVCSPGTADPYGPKAMRAGMGAQFLLPVVTEVSTLDLRARLESLAARGEHVPAVLVADPHQGDDVRTVHLETGAVVVLGAERSGPGAEWVDEWVDVRRVTIFQSRFDSLNVAMAGTILAYELCRGRSSK